MVWVEFPDGIEVEVNVSVEVFSDFVNGIGWSFSSDDYWTITQIDKKKWDRAWRGILRKYALMEDWDTVKELAWFIRMVEDEGIEEFYWWA